MKNHKLMDKYNPKEFEEKLYNEWEKKGYFKPSMDKTKESYCIMMPPPNVTGKLHMGHALDGTLQDILIRYKRMCGYNTLWLPGTDHAAIATEVKVVDKMKKEEGLTKADITRKQFLERAWTWTKEFGGEIQKQQRRLGCSCDWDRSRFTMDEGLSEAVLEQFVNLYNKGLIYKGTRMINWCPSCHTSISDAEVEFEEEASHLWHIRYQIKGTDKYLIVATTRPETMLGDTAVAVHPDDERYKDIVGKTCILPIMNKEIPIIADEFVEKEFGTGCVKITPAHDMNDYQAGLKHNLEIVEVFDDSSIMGDLVSEYKGLTTLEARKLIVKKLEEIDALVKTEAYTHNVGKCYRCHTTIEPRISEQWFVKMKELAEPAIKAVKEDDIKFVPKRYEKTYFNWMENIQDWCISRQLWWGHRIPAWYKDDKIKVQTTSPGEGWVQDPDVLDTWFSSALWPFSTLGWPDSTELLDRYFPNNVLVTGYDIIPFWVNRMTFQSLEFMGKRPFKDCLIHGLIRDKEGRKMSKSLGNGVDPMDVIDEYGCDALRFFLTTNSAPGMDLRYDEEKVKSSWNFINKLWNASRFVLMNIEDLKERTIIPEELTLYDKWILTKKNQLIKNVTKNMDKYEFHNVGNELYSFIWEDFCDWYIELTKANMTETTKTVLLDTLTDILKLLHPFMPYVTEEIYQKLPIKESESIMISTYPSVNKKDIYKEETEELESVLEDIVAIRNLKASNKITKDALVNFECKKEELIKIFASQLKIGEKNLTSDDPDNMVTCNYKSSNINITYFFEQEHIDTKALEEEINKLKQSIERREKLLSNANYVNKAPSNIVELDRKKLKEEKEKLQLLLEKTN